MFTLQLYDKSYCKHDGVITIDSAIVPRPGETVDLPDTADDVNSGRFMVFDVSHQIQSGKMVTLVRAKKAARMDRIYVLSENGHIVGPHSPDLGYHGDEAH